MVVNDVSGQPTSPTFEGQAVQEWTVCLTHKYSIEGLSRNVGLRFVTTKKWEDLFYTSVEAWSHEILVFFYLTTHLINEIIQHQIRGCQFIVNWLRRGWKLPRLNVRWSKSLKPGNAIGIASEPVKSFEPSTSQMQVSSVNPEPTALPPAVRLTLDALSSLVCVCVDVKDEHSNGTCSRASCDCSHLTGV